MMADGGGGTPEGARSEGESQPYADMQRMGMAELIARAEQLQVSGALAAQAALYKGWIATHPGDPWLHAAYFNYSVALAKSGDPMGAINAARECIRIKPDFPPAYINLGRLLEDFGQVGDAVLQWKALVDQMTAITGDSVKNKLLALEQLGRVLESHHLDGPAEDALRQSIDISVAQPPVVQHWIALRQRQCKWPTVEGWDHVKADALMARISPLSLANLYDDPLFQLARAWSYNKELVGPFRGGGLGVSRPARVRPAKLRIGYVSSDLREHAVGFAMTDVMEQHDRAGFEIYAYYCGIDRQDPTRARIGASVDCWRDINGLTDEQAAARIREDGIDILVDLNGYTKDARTRVFSLRPAPVAVNWFGFPGSMATPFHHYIIADPIVIPEGFERFYSEKVVRLPCYQPNDRKRKVATVKPARADEGLPEGALVYCCLNGMQKVTPAVFASWIRILAQVPRSVLWLLGGSDDTNARLSIRARQAGVAAERLIFAEKKPNPEHLARYALADLFLDTFPYGAHTTAADAIWMGVPVLTRPGRSFASRVCASLVTAAGLGDLICDGPAQYEARAIELGRNRDLLSKIKQALAARRPACLLFDTPRLVGALEHLYRGMWEEFRADRLPVPDLSNLDIYHEIGLELATGDVQFDSDEAYYATWTAALADRHAASPIRADARLWDGAGPWRDLTRVSAIEARRTAEATGRDDLAKAS
jgi:predicted O-linked N-acetylglucosamine transferase (SPINDLY family)